MKENNLLFSLKGSETDTARILVAVANKSCNHAGPGSGTKALGPKSIIRD